jgi:hypothetical protein
MDRWHWIMGLCFQVQYHSHTEMSVQNIKSNCWRPMACHQWYDPQRPRYSNCTRSHPREKYQAPHKIRITLEPITLIPSTRRRTKTDLNLISEYFLKISWENSSFIKIWQEEWLLYKSNIHFHHISPTFLEWEIPQTKVVERLKTDIMLFTYFL